MNILCDVKVNYYLSLFSILTLFCQAGHAQNPGAEDLLNQLLGRHCLYVYDPYKTPPSCTVRKQQDINSIQIAASKQSRECKCKGDAAYCLGEIGERGLIASEALKNYLEKGSSDIISGTRYNKCLTRAITAIGNLRPANGIETLVKYLSAPRKVVLEGSHDSPAQLCGLSETAAALSNYG